MADIVLPDMRQFVEGWSPEAVDALSGGMVWVSANWPAIQAAASSLLWVIAAAACWTAYRLLAALWVR